MLSDFQGRRLAQEAPEKNCSKRVQVTFVGDLDGVLLHEVLNALALNVYPAIVCHSDVHELMADLHLLRGDVLLRPRPCVEARNVVGLALHVLEADLLFRIVGAVEQV